MSRGNETLWSSRLSVWNYSDHLHTHCCTRKEKTLLLLQVFDLRQKRDLRRWLPGPPRARWHPSSHQCCCLSVTKGGDSCVTCSDQAKRRDANVEDYSMRSYLHYRYGKKQLWITLNIHAQFNTKFLHVICLEAHKDGFSLSPTVKSCWRVLLGWEARRQYCFL